MAHSYAAALALMVCCICAVDVAIAATTSAANAPVSLDAFFTVRRCLPGHAALVDCIFCALMKDGTNQGRTNPWKNESSC